MRIFLIINLLIVIINSIEYRINNNCAWPDDCYITMKFTKTCAIESATVQPANRSKPTEQQLKDMSSKHSALQCFGFPKESTIRCYNRCDTSTIIKDRDIPENHMYQYTSQYFQENLEIYKKLNASDTDIRVQDFGYGRVQDKKEEYKFWNECVLKGLKNSTSTLTNKKSIAPIKVDLDCDQLSTFCRFVIEYTLDGIKSITLEEESRTDLKVTGFYAKNVYSCRIFEKTIECICRRIASRCRSFDHLIEAIYLLGRDKVIRGEYPEIEGESGKEHDENIPKVLEMLQNFRTNYPKDIYGSFKMDCEKKESCAGFCSLTFQIDKTCENIGWMASHQTRMFISPHRFVDTDRTGSIALELHLEDYNRLLVKVYCRMGCIVDNSIYVPIMDVLNRQMATNDDIILFKSYTNTENKEKEEYFACAYYSFRNEFLKSMYETYDIPTEQPQTIREIPKSNEILSLVISTVFASIIVIMIILIIIVGTISYFRSQIKKQPITFSKKTVIAHRKKPIGKSAEFGNSKDKTGDFYDNISKKTSTMNHTDLASTVEDTKSRD